MPQDRPIGVFGLFDSSAWLNLQVPAEHREAFKELIQRGINLWPDAPYRIKEIADLITVGKIMQPYQPDGSVNPPRRGNTSGE